MDSLRLKRLFALLVLEIAFITAAILLYNYFFGFITPYLLSGISELNQTFIKLVGLSLVLASGMTLFERWKLLKMPAGTAKKPLCDPAVEL
jgi:hypothetical protein